MPTLRQHICRTTPQDSAIWDERVRRLEDRILETEAVLAEVSASQHRDLWALQIWARALRLGNSVLTAKHPVHAELAAQYEGGAIPASVPAQWSPPPAWVIDGPPDRQVAAATLLDLLDDRDAAVLDGDLRLREPAELENKINLALAQVEVILKAMAPDMVGLEPSIWTMQGDPARFRAELLALAQSYRDARDIRTAVEAAQRSAEAARESAGTTAESSLAKEFGDLAKKQAIAANGWLGGAILVAVATVIYAGAVAFEFTRIVPEADSAGELNRRLAVALPLLLLSGVLAAEATRYRRVAQWAKIIATQLKSLRALTDELDPESADALRLDVGRMALLSSPAGGSDSESSSEVLAEVMRKLAKP